MFATVKILIAREKKLESVEYEISMPLLRRWYLCQIRKVIFKDEQNKRTEFRVSRSDDDKFRLQIKLLPI